MADGNGATAGERNEEVRGWPAVKAAGSDNFFLRRIRPYVLKVEDRQTQQSLLQFIASSEIMMMLVTILMLLRLMFQQMRLGVEQLARNPKCPAVVGRGPNHTISADGHDKLMGFMKDTFPLAVYGWQDVFSGCILFLNIWVSNSNPKLIGRWYLDYLYKKKVISQRLRLDKGSETGDFATIHSFLREKHSDCPEDTVSYGPSTSNKIERWWRELHLRMEKYFKRQLLILLEEGLYDPNNSKDRDLLAYVYVPVISKELENFRCSWNTHRVRRQKDAQLPKGIPEHLYSFPEKYGAEECGLPVSAEQLDEVAELSGVMAFGNDYLDPATRVECERIIPDVDTVKPSDAKETYLFLKAHFVPNTSSSGIS
eukprot:gene908-10664_t